MRFDQLRAFHIAEPDGTRRRVVTEITRPTMYMLVDAAGMHRDRIEAEIAWVRERLQPGFDLVLVWPRGSEREAAACVARSSVGAVIDADGDLGRWAAPGGGRVAILVDAVARSVEEVTGTHTIFGVGRRPFPQPGDRTIDLGDVQL